MCKLINTDNTIINVNNERTMKLPSGGNCKSTNVIYAARCQTHEKIYIGQSGEELKDHFHKHCNDAKKRPDNCELSEQVASDNHDFDKDIDVTILKSDLPFKAERKHHKDRMICPIGTKLPNGLNEKVTAYGREMYDFAQNLLQ